VLRLERIGIEDFVYQKNGFGQDWKEMRESQTGNLRIQIPQKLLGSDAPIHVLPNHWQSV